MMETRRDKNGMTGGDAAGIMFCVQKYFHVFSLFSCIKQRERGWEGGRRNASVEKGRTSVFMLLSNRATPPSQATALIAQNVIIPSDVTNNVECL